MLTFLFVIIAFFAGYLIKAKITQSDEDMLIEANESLRSENRQLGEKLMTQREKVSDLANQLCPYQEAEKRVLKREADKKAKAEKEKQAKKDKANKAKLARQKKAKEAKDKREWDEHNKAILAEGRKSKKAAKKKKTKRSKKSKK